MELNWLLLLMPGLGTLFLIGELLVRMRGLFAILGIIFMTIYFSNYLELGTSFILMIMIYFIGLLLIVLDGKVINDGTLAIIGAVIMTTVVAIAAPNLLAGLYAVCSVIIGGAASILFLKIFKNQRRELWSKMMLKDRLTTEKGYSSLNQSYLSLLGKTGVTLNDLRPVGTIRIDDEDYSAVSNGEWIPKGTEVEVVHVDGTKIQVRRVESQVNTNKK